MKSSKFLTVLAVVVFLISSTSSKSQIIDRAENKAKNKTNQRVDQKIDNGIDSGLDAIEGLFKRKKKNKSKQEDNTEEANSANQNESSPEQASASGLFSADPGDVKDTYSFDHSVDLLVETYNKRGKPQEEVQMTMFISESDDVFGMKSNTSEGSATVIFEIDNAQMITMSDAGGQKMGMVMNLNPKDLEDMQDEEEKEADISFTKTGRTKTISGYTCEEYQMHNSEADDDYDYFLWMTEDDDLNWMEAFTEMMKHQKMRKTQMANDYPEGMMVQMVAKSKKSDEKNVTTVQEVNMNDNVEISTGGFQFISMGGGGR